MTVTVPAVVDHQPLTPLDVGATKAAMETYQSGLHALLVDDDWQTFKAKDGSTQRFVKRSGWRKIALWFNLSIETPKIESDRDPNGNARRARVIAKAIAPNGRYAEGDGACAITERGFSKPEHDIPATATTRAINRAISNLVGLGAVSAEEIANDSETTPVEPRAFGPLANEKQGKEALDALKVILVGYRLGDHAELYLNALSNAFDDGLTECSARTLIGLAGWIERRQNDKASQSEETHTNAD